jgi:hypothetical protein
MMRISAAIFVVLLSTGAVAQDKIGKDKAPIVLKKALAEVQKKKSAAINESAELVAGPRRAPPSVFEGVLRKDFAAVKGAAEVYGRARPTSSTWAAVRSARRRWRPGGRRRPELPQPVAAPRGARPERVGPQFGPDEMVDGKDCKAVDIALDPALHEAVPEGVRRPHEQGDARAPAAASARCST